MNTEYIVVTLNTPDIIATMDSFTGTNLVASQTTFICWDWVNPTDTNLATAQAMDGYKGTVKIS